jgi:hypothetical protein
MGPNGFYAAVVKNGKEEWGPDFHMSSTFIRDHRPFWVKDPTRDVCLCRYHLAFDLYAKGLKKLRQSIGCKCDVCKNPMECATGRELRRSLTCPRGDDEYDDRACINGECDTCADGALLDLIMCPDAQNLASDAEVRWERYEKQPTGQVCSSSHRFCSLHTTHPHRLVVFPQDEFGEDTYKHDFYEVRHP